MIQVQHLIDACSIGALYALFALGIAMIFGVMRLVNFAHGELIMIGAYSLYLLGDRPIVMLVALSSAIVVFAAVLMERVAFRPVRQASPATLLVTSFAVSVFLQNLATLIFGARAKPLATPAVLQESFDIGSLRIGKLSVLIMVVLAVCVVGLTLFLKRTRMGMHMRGAAENFRMARLLGVRANGVIVVAFAISGFLAAIAAYLLTAQTGALSPTMGTTPVIIAFVAVIVGGLGSLVGAVAGGFLLGGLTTALQVWLPLELRNYRDAFMYGAVILILLIRPQGLVVLKARGTRV